MAFGDPDSGTKKAKSIAEDVYGKDSINFISIYNSMSGVWQVRSRMDKAVEYLKCFQNIKFNDKIVNEFLGIVAVYTTGSKVRMINGEEAVVVRQNREFPDRPVVRITKSKRGEYLSNGKEIDLLKERTNFITDVLN